MFFQVSALCLLYFASDFQSQRSRRFAEDESVRGGWSQPPGLPCRPAAPRQHSRPRVRRHEMGVEDLGVGDKQELGIK